MSEENGLTINHRQSRRAPAVKVTDLDCADDLALLSDTIQQLVRDLEHAAKVTGLSMNASKTEHMAINIAPEESSISSVSEDIIERVEDFKYLGSYIAESRKDFHTRKGMA